MAGETPRVVATPMAVNPAICPALGRRIHRAPATAATPQKATTAMTASPRVARVQTSMASQCGASGMPRKSGTCRNSQG